MIGCKRDKLAGIEARDNRRRQGGGRCARRDARRCVVANIDGLAFRLCSPVATDVGY